MILYVLFVHLPIIFIGTFALILITESDKYSESQKNLTTALYITLVVVLSFGLVFVAIKKLLKYKKDLKARQEDLQKVFDQLNYSQL